MGGTYWSDDTYAQRTTQRKATGQSAFAYSQAQASAPKGSQRAHKSMDPFGIATRECRDSDAHLESRAIAIGLDVTGSMEAVPKTMQTELCKLMALLTKDGCVKDAAILMAGIGDAHCDSVPMQIGQFESGIEIENDLTNLYLEGGGGGQRKEDYELFLFFLARMTSIDCWEKRQKKGFAFIIGDEMPYPNVDRRFVHAVFGKTIEADIPLQTILDEARERWEIFYIMPNMTSYYNDKDVCDSLRKLFGENYLRLDKPEGVCDLIVSTIALLECGDLNAATSALKAAGTDLAVIGAVENALADVAKSRGRTGCDLALAGSGAGSGIEAL